MFKPNQPNDDNSTRKTIKSATCFIKCGEDWLFIHRTKKGSDTDAGRLNGVGGKLEKGENFLDCALRETREETGYIVEAKDCRLAGVVNMEGGYQDDWLMCFFVIEVPSKDTPIGAENEEGQLIWLNQDEVLSSGYELVDDLNYCWRDIVANKGIIFASSTADCNEKISDWQATFLKQ